jgi:hypothetical protein
MKGNDRILLVALTAFLCAFPLNAQISPTVEVTRDYDVKLLSIDKPFIGTAVPDSLRMFHVNMDYYTIDKPYGDVYDFTPHRTFLLAREARPKDPILFARLSGALPLSVDGALFLQTPARKGFSLSAYVDHSSYWPTGDTLAYDLRRTGFMKNRAGLKGRYEWDKGEASLDLHYAGDAFRYWDTLFTKSVSNRFGATVNVHSSDYADIRPFYDVTVSYNYLNGGINAGAIYSGTFMEHTLDVCATGGGIIRNSRILLDFESHSRFSSQDANIFSVTPYYQYINDLVDIRAGLRIAGSTHYYEDADIYSGNVKNFFPVLDFRVGVIPDLLWLRVSVDGDNYLNSMTDKRSISPWIAASPKLDYSFDSYRGKAELRLCVRDRLTLSGFVGYAAGKNMPFLAPVDSLHVQNFEYANASRVTVGADAVWNSKDVEAAAYYRFNKCDREDGGTVSLVPSHEAGGYVRYDYRGRIFARVSFDYRSSVLFGSSTIDPVYDLGFSAGYVMDKYFTFFLKAGNLIGKKNEYVPWSISQPRNFGVGVVFKF